MGKMDVLREKADQVRSEANVSALSLKNMPNQISEIASALEQGRAQTGRFQERVNAQVAQAIRLITQVQDRLGEMKPLAPMTPLEVESLPSLQFWQSLSKKQEQCAREMEVMRRMVKVIYRTSGTLVGWKAQQVVILIVLAILLLVNLILWGITGYRNAGISIKDIDKMAQEVDTLRKMDRKWERFYQSLDPQGRKVIEEWWEANP